MNNLMYVLTDYTFHIVALGATLLGMMSGVIGSFAVLKKQSLIGDAIAHAALPGIAITFLLTQTKSNEFLLVGALVTGLLATVCMHTMKTYSKIEVESAMSLILSTFFGLGLVLLTYIQTIPNAHQAGLDRFIFGQAATLLQSDVLLIAIMAIVSMSVIILCWKELKLVTFDTIFAQSIGISPKTISLFLSVLIVLVSIVGLQTVGVILMSALLVAPGVAARQWTHKLETMVILAGIFGGVSGGIGTLVSSLMTKIPTGPSIVLSMGIIVLISIVFAPSRGVVWRLHHSRIQQRRLAQEHILGLLYELLCQQQRVFNRHNVASMLQMKVTTQAQLYDMLRELERLRKQGFVYCENDQWTLTKRGVEYVETLYSKEEQYGTP